MNRNILILISALALLTGLNGCRRENGHGPVVSESRNSLPFFALKVDLPGTVFYKEGTEFNIKLEAQRNILDLIETPVVNGELVLKFKDNVDLRSHEQLRITVTSPAIKSLVLNGSGSFTIVGSFQPDELFVHLKGSGTVNIPTITTQELSAVLNGSGTIKVADGDVFLAETSSNGSGSIDFSGVSADHGVASIKGSGSVRLQVQHTLYCRITGSGSIYYKGNPRIDKEITGSGKIVKE